MINSKLLLITVFTLTAIPFGYGIEMTEAQHIKNKSQQERTSPLTLAGGSLSERQEFERSLVENFKQELQSFYIAQINTYKDALSKLQLEITLWEDRSEVRELVVKNNNNKIHLPGSEKLKTHLEGIINKERKHIASVKSLKNTKEIFEFIMEDRLRGMPARGILRAAYKTKEYLAKNSDLIKKSSIEFIYNTQFVENSFFSPLTTNIDTNPQKYHEINASIAQSILHGYNFISNFFLKILPWLPYPDIKKSIEFNHMEIFKNQLTHFKSFFEIQKFWETAKAIDTNADLFEKKASIFQKSGRDTNLDQYRKLPFYKFAELIKINPSCDYDTIANTFTDHI